MLRPTELARLATTLGGLPILGCLNGSPAEEAGIRYGDILLSINGVPTGSWDDYLQARAQCGNKVSARVFREGTEFDVSLILRASKVTPFEILGELQTRGILPLGESRDSGLDQ